MKIRELLPNDPWWSFCADEDIVPIFVALAEKLPIFIDLTGNLSFDHAYSTRSAEKTVISHWSKLFTKFGNEWIEGEAHTAITNNVFFDKLADTLIAVYGEGWQRLHDALHLDYNPIENYAMVESGHDEHNSARNTAGTSQTDNETSGSSFGFNSNTAVPTDVAKGTSGTNDRREEREEDAKNHQFRRTGNIGVTTSQQMLESEYELRKKTFMGKVFKDVDDFLTLAIYD